MPTSSSLLINPCKFPNFLSSQQNPCNKFNFKTQQFLLQNHNNLFPFYTNNKKINSQFSNPKRIKAVITMEGTDQSSKSTESMNNLLFVEMGVGYDQHGQNVTSAAMRACRDAISSNSIPAFRRGSIPGVSFEQMKLQIKLGVPHALQQSLDIEKVKSVFPYGKILDVEVVDGGLICSSGVHVEEMGDKNDDCYIVNAAVYDSGHQPCICHGELCQNLSKDEYGLTMLEGICNRNEAI